MAQTTLVELSGRGTNPKTTLYVGGLEDSVTEQMLHAAFLPFGDIKDVSVPMDHATGKHRGFGFVEYELPEDAADAMDNMHNGGGGWNGCPLGARGRRWGHGLLHSLFHHDGGRQCCSDECRECLHSSHRFRAELLGRVLRVNYAQPSKIKGGDKGWASQAVWADTDDW